MVFPIRGKSCELKRETPPKTKQQIHEAARELFPSSRVGGVVFAAFPLTDGPPHVVQSDSSHQHGDGEVAPVPFSGWQKEEGERQ